MNYPVKTERICTSGVIYEGSSEQTVDADIKLPDYCPDIQKILKCRIDPQIESRNIVGDRLEIEGASIVRVIYIDAIKNSVRCTEQSCPFTITVALPSSANSAVISTDIRVSYLNCRALSPRRLSIHGAFVVNIKVIDRLEQHICSHIKGSDIQQKKSSMYYSELSGVTQQQFSVTEVLETGQNTPSVQSIMRADVCAVEKDHSLVSGKLMYKGELLVKLMYLSDSDSGKIETLECNIPFSQVIPVNGVGENGETALRVEVMNSSICLRTEIGFDDPLPVLNARLCVTVFSYEKRETTLVTDCYSTEYKTDTTSAQCILPFLSSLINETVIEKTNVDFTDNSVFKVIDVWCESSATVCENVDGKARLKGKFNICVLAQDADENAFYAERAVEFSRDIKSIGDKADLICNIYTDCISSSYRICNEKRIEVRIELLLTGELYENAKVDAVMQVEADESSPFVRENDSALILYYAHKGEDIWNIARSYSISVEKVRTDNDLPSDILSDDIMVMLPV